MAHQVTKLEALVLNDTAYHEHCASNGGRPECADDVHPWLWVDEIAANCGITMDQVKGVLASLVQKDWVGISDGGTDEAAIWFTEAGYQAWLTIDDNRADAQKETTMTTQSITIQGNTVTHEQLETASIKDLVDTYNGLMEQTGGKAVKKFKDKATAVARVIKVATEVAEAEQAEQAEPVTEEAPKAKAKKEKATEEAPKERKKREKHFVFPFDADRFADHGTPRKGSLRESAVKKLMRKSGATLAEIEALVVEFDEARDKEPFNVERRAYELVRLVHYWMGYRLSQDGKRIMAHTS